MTDQTIPADKVRAILANRDLRAAEMIAEIESILPTPPLPTLADMTADERAACRWMQCDVAEVRGRWVLITPPDEDSLAGLIDPDEDICWFLPERVTPRPDLPRMEWPGDKKPAPAPALPDGFRLAEHPDYGRVIVTTPDPGCDGDVYFVYPETVLSLGFNSGWCYPDELTYIDGPTTKGAGTTTGPNDVAVGTVIESADDPRIAALPVGSILLDRNEEATTKRHWGWSGAGFSPIVYERDRFAPWTVLHIPKEADQ